MEYSVGLRDMRPLRGAVACLRLEHHTLEHIVRWSSMKRINDPRVLPGEALYELPNGQVRLVTRSGSHCDWTLSEWDEYITEYNENLCSVDRIDFLIDSIRSRDLVATSEVIDALLDLRVVAAREREAHKRTVGMWMAEVERGNLTEA